MADAHTPDVARPAAGAPARSTNVLGVVGFVLAIVGFNVIAIILGAVALSQIKRTGEKGRAFALAAIWIAIIEIVLFVVILIIAFAIAAASNVTVS